MVLNEEYIADGKALIQKLDDQGLKIESAFWFFFPDISNWKLVFGTPEVVKNGPKSVYKEIQKALSKLDLKSKILLDDISILKPNAPLSNLLKFAVRTGPGISQIRFSNNIINGQKIEDALIYRL